MKYNNQQLIEVAGGTIGKVRGIKNRNRYPLKIDNSEREINPKQFGGLASRYVSGILKPGLWK